MREPGHGERFHGFEGRAPGRSMGAVVPRDGGSFFCSGWLFGAGPGELRLGRGGVRSLRRLRSLTERCGSGAPSPGTLGGRVPDIQEVGELARRWVPLPSHRGCRCSSTSRRLLSGPGGQGVRAGIRRKQPVNEYPGREFYGNERALRPERTKKPLVCPLKGRPFWAAENLPNTIK